MKNTDKNKGNTTIVILIILAVLIGGYFYIRESPKNTEEAKQSDVIGQVEREGAENKIPEGAMMEDGTKLSEEMAGTYENYSPDKLALAENGDVVLFFHASWCPYCRAVENDINKNFSQIPDSVHILKTDYDSNVPLRQKYGVTYQHTFVQVDASGNLIKKWSGSETLSEIIAQIQ